MASTQVPLGPPWVHHSRLGLCPGARSTPLSSLALPPPLAAPSVTSALCVLSLSRKRRMPIDFSRAMMKEAMSHALPQTPGQTLGQTLTGWRVHAWALAMAAGGTCHQAKPLAFAAKHLPCHLRDRRDTNPVYDGTRRRDTNTRNDEDQLHHKFEIHKLLCKLDWTTKTVPLNPLPFTNMRPLSVAPRVIVLSTLAFAAPVTKTNSSTTPMDSSDQWIEVGAPLGEEVASLTSYWPPSRTDFWTDCYRDEQCSGNCDDCIRKECKDKYGTCRRCCRPC